MLGAMQFKACRICRARLTPLHNRQGEGGWRQIIRTPNVTLVVVAAEVVCEVPRANWEHAHTPCDVVLLEGWPRTEIT